LTACPDLRVLERLVLGQIPGIEAEQLEQHVSGCRQCGEALKQVRGDDVLVSALRNTPPVDPSATELVESLIPCLKRLRVPDANRTLPDASSAKEPTGFSSDVTETFDFLAPAQAPDEIGRLGSYRVLKVLGSGGMGVVFVADDPRLKRRIAL